MENSFNIPVLFLIFNRLDTTKKVFEEIKKIKPKQLFIAGDGPRNKEEANIVKSTRDIISEVDWQCEVKTLFRDKNLGCKLAVSSAIDWFFENNEMGIILEDDCLPHTSFFRYCEELLIKYKNEDKIMHIGGLNALSKVSLNESYYFAKFGPIWGWATWRRAWKYYDVQMQSWEKVKSEKTYKQFCDTKIEELWRENIYDRVKDGLINTWDYQWSYAKLMNNGLSIVPAINLVTNIGFGENATHTNTNISLSNINIDQGMSFPLIHPEKILRNVQLDKKFFNSFVLKNKIKGTLNKIFGK